MSIVRVGMAEDDKFGAGYDAIFGGRKGGAKKAEAAKAAAAKKPAAKPAAKKPAAKAKKK